MKERRKKKWWCKECREFWEEESKRQGKKKEPLCEQCGWPGVDIDNVDAWKVFQLACSDANGVTIAGVKALCEIKGIRDINDCLEKVLDLASKTREEDPLSPPSAGGN